MNSPNILYGLKSIEYGNHEKKCEVVRRILSVHPNEGDRYYLRMLLMHIRKPTSFRNLQTINRQVYATFNETAEKLGLLNINNNADICLNEAILYQMPASLRQLFAVFLVHCHPQNPKELWLKYEDYLSEDIKFNKSLSQEAVQFKVLQQIDKYLRLMGKSFDDFHLIDILLQTFTHE